MTAYIWPASAQHWVQDFVPPDHQGDWILRLRGPELLEDVACIVDEYQPSMIISPTVGALLLLGVGRGSRCTSIGIVPAAGPRHVDFLHQSYTRVLPLLSRGYPGLSTSGHYACWSDTDTHLGSLAAVYPGTWEVIVDPTRSVQGLPQSEQGEAPAG